MVIGVKLFLILEDARSPKKYQTKYIYCILVHIYI